MSIYLRKEHSGLRGKELTDVIESTYPHLRENNRYWNKLIRRDIKEYCDCLKEQRPYTIYYAHHNKLHMPVMRVECVSRVELEDSHITPIAEFLYDHELTIQGAAHAFVNYNSNNWPSVCVARDTQLYVVCMCMQIMPRSLDSLNKFVKAITLLCEIRIPDLVDTRIKFIGSKCTTYESPGVTLVVSNSKCKLHHSTVLPASIAGSLLSKKRIISPNMEVDGKDINVVHLPYFTDTNKAEHVAREISAGYGCSVTLC